MSSLIRLGRAIVSWVGLQISSPASRSTRPPHHYETSPSPTTGGSVMYGLPSGSYSDGSSASSARGSGTASTQMTPSNSSKASTDNSHLKDRYGIAQAFAPEDE